jgi:hypothetical protein
MLWPFAWGKADRGLRWQAIRPCISETTTEIAMHRHVPLGIFTGAYAPYYEKAGAVVGGIFNTVLPNEIRPDRFPEICDIQYNPG